MGKVTIMEGRCGSRLDSNWPILYSTAMLTQSDESLVYMNNGGVAIARSSNRFSVTPFGKEVGRIINSS